MMLVLPLCASGTAIAKPYPDEYLGNIQKDMPDIYAQYGRQAIMTEGYRICGYGALRMDITQKLDRIVIDMPMSRDDAMTMKIYAEADLDCEPDRE